MKVIFSFIFQDSNFAYSVECLESVRTILKKLCISLKKNLSSAKALAIVGKCKGKTVLGDAVRSREKVMF